MPQEIKEAKAPKEQRIARLHHPLKDVQHLVSVLEAFGWNISIRQALDDPEDWQDDVILLRGTGEKYKRIRQADEGDSNG
jgi:hypothetical protein